MATETRRETNPIRNRLFRGLMMTMGAALVALAARSAPADDGVVEINQASALAGSIPGDAPGFPVTITQPGSYRLTGSLTISDPNTDVIEVSASDVSIDLNGFGITGVTFCGGAPPNCSDTGTGSAIRIHSPAQVLIVRNGFIRQMGSDCISGGIQSLMENLQVLECGGNGIVAGELSTVRGSIVRLAHDNGIQVGNRSLATGNLVVFSGSFGLSVSSFSGYGDNIMSSNNLGGGGVQVDGFGIQTSTNVCNGAPCT